MIKKRLLRSILLIALSPPALLTAAEKNKEVEVVFKSDPPLPLVNLLKPHNPGFEDGLKHWGVEKQAKKYDNIQLTSDAHTGKQALKVNSKHGGAFQMLATKMKGVMRKGEKYLLVCYVKANEKVSQSGGLKLGCGASLVFYGDGWKRASGTTAKTGFTYGQWRKVVSAPVEYPSWANVIVLNLGISYTKGTGIIDDIALYPAETILTVNVSSNKTRIKQVVVEDEKGTVILDSGPLRGKTKRFLRKIKVSTAKQYTLRILNGDNDVFQFSYPNTDESEQKIK